MSESLNILIACGGTGGHLFPGIAVGEAMRARGHGVVLLISEKNVDAEGAAKYGHLKFETIPMVAKPPLFSLRTPSFFWRTWQSVRRCREIIRRHRADVVLGMGGFTSLPPVVAGHGLGLKTFVHDSNARPGRANVLTSRFCTCVFLGFEAAGAYFPNKHQELTGTPVRPELAVRPTRVEAAARFGLDPGRPVILVMGGSQGARRLNEFAAEAAGRMPSDIQVLHIAGASDFERIQETVGQRTGYRVLGFCNEMADAYAAADLVVARAGASSLNEIALCGLPSVLVPYPYAADDHQTANARVFADVGAAVLVQERDLDPLRLEELAVSLVRDLPTRERMAKAAGALAVADAAGRVCAAIEDSFTRS